jgi:integrase
VAKILTDAAIRKLKPKRGERRELPDSCPGLYLAVYESGIKSFTLRYKRPGGGKSVRMTLGRFDPTGHEVDGEPKVGDPLTLRSARLLVAQLQRDRKRGKDPSAQNRLSRTMAVQTADNTFASCALQFVEEHMVKRADGERRPRGWQEGARLLGWSFPADPRDGEPEVIRGSLCDRWRDRPVNEISPLEIDAVIDESRKHGIPGMGRNNKGSSSNRSRKVFGALSALFGWLRKQPRRGVVINPVAGLARPGAPAARERVLNIKTDINQADELRWFWNACSEVGQPWEVLLKLLLITGCRRDEIGQMRWTELSDHFTMLRLPGTRTKNSRPHDLPLPPLATKLLEGIEPIEDCPWVFTIQGRSPIAGYAKAKRRLDAAMTALAKAEHGPDDAEIPPWRLHDLRRTAATGMADIGILPHVIEAVLNHVSGAKASVAGIYNRATYEPEKKAALTKWSEYIERVVTGQAATVVPIGQRRA